MNTGWLWDRKISKTTAKRILKNRDDKRFFDMAALLLSRNNEPRHIFRNYLDSFVFCQNWSAIKKRMRRDNWNDPRIIFWQAIYEKLAEKYRKKGISFRRTSASSVPLYAHAGNKIRDMRRQYKMSQSELANKIRVSQQLI